MLLQAFSAIFVLSTGSVGSATLPEQSYKKAKNITSVRFMTNTSYVNNVKDIEQNATYGFCIWYSSKFMYKEFVLLPYNRWILKVDS